MDPWSDLPTITDPAELDVYGVPAPAVRDKVLPVLEPVHCEFLAHAPLVFLGTADADGRCDVSPKGDPDNVALVLDERTLALPERPGNKRMDGFRNVLTNPHVGLLFVIPGRPETLRVNGTVRVVTDGPFFGDLEVQGHRPRLAVVVDVEEVFYHCPKAFMRSRAWKPETWRPDAVRSYADIAKALWRRDDPPEEVDAHYAAVSYGAQLYAPEPTPSATR